MPVLTTAMPASSTRPGRHLDVPLHWQQWNLRSGLIDAVATEVRAEAAGVLVQAPRRRSPTNREAATR